MEFNRFKKRKKPNKNKLIFLLVALLVILYIWMNASNLIENLL